MKKSQKSNTFADTMMLFVIMLIMVVVTLGFFISNDVMADVVKQQKFMAIYTVQYNAITLEEAAQKEAAFRTTYPDACKVDIEIKEASETEFTISYSENWIDIGADNLVVGGGD